MGFHIRFITYIKAIFITKAVKFRTVRIMGGTDGIYITLLHQTQILYHPLTAAHITGVRMAFMPVHAF